ncbi:hypothetical protein [Succinivibrio dextrinosolvens]|uniref:hypothetical protein n=1 Tax=Succinivibrio dextrinosolvens TaxID=83771 RepID=UPI0012DC9B94|nr:hypothetical protein [Succinivibrio dextrinosolvens]
MSSIKQSIIHARIFLILTEKNYLTGTIMQDEYDKYLEEVKKIETENNKYIGIFENELKSKGLTKKTISNHVFNIELFLNDFLAERYKVCFANSLEYFDEFFDFFTRKCMWSTPATVKSTAGSLKKFYQCMMENNVISKDDFSELKEMMKDNMVYWQESCY